MPPGTDPPVPLGAARSPCAPGTSHAGALKGAINFMSNAYHTHWHAQRVAAGLAEPDPEPAPGTQPFTHLRDLVGAGRRQLKEGDLRREVHVPVAQAQRLLQTERVAWLPGMLLPMPPVSGGDTAALHKRLRAWHTLPASCAVACAPMLVPSTMEATSRR